MPIPNPTFCNHKILQLTPSPFAPLAGYTPPTHRTLLAARTPYGRVPPLSSTSSQAAETLIQAFPAPLVLPFDALNYEPDESPQSFRSWKAEKCRNRMEMERKTIYVAGSPRMGEGAGWMEGWMNPNVQKDGKGGEKERERDEDVVLKKQSEVLEERRQAKRVKRDKTAGTVNEDRDESREHLQPPSVDETISYLRAFYPGLQVKELPTPFTWNPWTTASSKKRSTAMPTSTPKFVALSHGTSSTRIRLRPSPDTLFPIQLNLDDILDACIAALPSDAYAMLLLISHDMYETPDDDFCCGRAYGGSRVCVVQSARYNPLLDAQTGIDMAHSWPMSHCKSYVDKLCKAEDIGSMKPTAKQTRLGRSGPLRAAITAASTLPPIATSTPDLQMLWASRTARTAAHELGHCLALSHCPHHACTLQSSASLPEDARQPPYLCPTCLAKLSYAIAVELHGGEEKDREEWVRRRYEGMLEWCEEGGKGKRRGRVAVWRGLAGWTRAILEAESGEDMGNVNVLSET